MTNPTPLPARFAPLLMGSAAGLAVSAGMVLTAAASHTRAAAETPPPIAQAATLANAPEAPPPPQTVSVSVRPGERLESAVRRLGIPAAEARSVMQALGDADTLDTVHIKAGLMLQATVAHPDGAKKPGQLLGLAMKTGPVTSLTLTRAPDGAFKLAEHAEQIHDETTVAQGNVKGSIYQAAVKAGATPALTAEVVKLFGHKVDFRELQPDDGFRLVFDRKVSESGKTVETGELRYAEIDTDGHKTRFFRFDNHGHSEFFDELGRNIKGFLLRTPVDGARVTSGFGMRFHPLLGYTRMHQGIDFGAPKGTPVFAAGDGVVAEIKHSAGYGNWLKIRHNGGWATGYGHLSAYARHLHIGEHVRQGEVVAYVGATGLATGPHLHYEVFKAAQRVNPKGAKVPQGTILEGRLLKAFNTQKAHIQYLLAKASGKHARTQLASLDMHPQDAVRSSGRGTR